MKKLFTSLTLSAALLSASAGNLVINGDFEDENYEFETPYEWEPDFKAVTSLPGWTINAMDVWNMALSLYSHEYMDDIDGEIITEDNANFAFLRRFQNNAWETGRFSQVVTGLEPGKEYYLDALVCQNNGTAPGCSDFSHGFVIKENNENGRQIFKESSAALYGQEWYRYEHKFKATTDRIYLEVYYVNPWRGGEGQGKTDDSWFAVDNVMIYPAEEYAENHPNLEEPDPVDPSTVDYTNHVVNGDFEDENYEFDTPYAEWEPDFRAVTSLPGWTLNAMDVWNMALSLYSHEYMDDIDGEVITEDNANFAFMRRYSKNAWETGRFSQIITGLDPEKEYYLDALVCQNDGEAPGCSDFSHGFIIKDGNENGRQIFKESAAALEGQEWFRYEHKFKPVNDRVYLEVYYVNPWRGGEGQGETKDSWFAVDNVKVYDANAYEHFHKDNTGVEAIAVAPVEAVDGVYTLQGYKVADSTAAIGDRHGIFIVRAGAKAYKIAR